ncbi:putative colanic acid biosynthesis UDP-glucose lipid carrier transferase [Gibbsiella quercinecans]|nr:undecaprenyl-phosphate glucose phosphotransferase [Gibbsiella quercinecans]TCT91866.1 putative colanic acid biosynthesis UDP-glucose lipid carrier transferase [Gibbsiella quercinecans]
MTKNNKGQHKYNASLISVLQRFSDIFIIFSSLYFVCFISKVEFDHTYWLLGFGVLAMFQMIGGLTEFYRSWRGVKFSSEMQSILQNWTLSLIFSTGILSFFDTFDIHFHVFVKWYVLVCFGFTIFRLFIRYAIGYARRIGYNNRKVAIVGTLPIGINLAKNFQDATWLGFDVKGIYSDSEIESREGIPYGGTLSKLVSQAKSGHIDRVYIAMPMSDEVKIKQLVTELTDTTCSVMLIPDVLTFNMLQSRVEEVNGVPVVSLFDTPMSGINMLLKRIEDIVLSLCILLFISPVLVIIALFVKFTSHGPIIFRQTRYGIDGKPIKVWKFRSMRVMENGDKVIQAKKVDLRVTPVGGFLRRTSLDELPQFFNVLKGDMSIVGPRPHAVVHNEQYRTLIKGYMLRHKMKPGITGWAQINGWRGETDTLEKMEKRVEYDLDYIRDWSIWLDLKIIFLTVFKGFINKSAY